MSVVDVLFSAFDERPSQHLKELMDVTQKGQVRAPGTAQPRDKRNGTQHLRSFTLLFLSSQKHLKKILKEIGTYNPAGGPKHTWQLKPEYSLNNVGIN